MFLDKLVRMAKVFPVVIYDGSANHTETAILRAAGIKWLPGLRQRAFATMLTHPLAAKATPGEAEPAEEGAATEVTAAS